MRVFVPEAIMLLDYGACIDTAWRGPYTHSPEANIHVYAGVGLPGYTVPMETKSYFWDTRHRPMNDCVHSKLVNAEGVEVIPNGYVEYSGSNRALYSPAFLSYNNMEFDEGPDKYGGLDLYHIHTAINGSYINDRNVAMFATTDSKWSNTRCTITVNFKFYYCTVEHKVGRPTVEYATVTMYLYYTNKYNNLKYPWAETHIVGQRQAPDVYVQCGDPDVNALLEEYFMGAVAAYADSIAPGITRYYQRAGGISWYYYHPGTGDLVGSIAEYVLNHLPDLPALGRKTKWQKWYFRYFANGKTTIWPEPIPPDRRFLFHEDERIISHVDPILLRNMGLQNYWWNVLVQNAYLDALEHVPTLNDNSISNIIEVAGFIKGLVVDHKIDIPKSLGDVWLSYRYSYTTTKLDAEEAISFMHRYRDLGTLEKWIHCFGASHHHFISDEFEADVTCRCGLRIRPKDVAVLQKIWRALYTYGLQPNFYVVWDSIPYSFIVDWLLPVGNLMHALDAGSMYSGTYYDIKDVVFSLSYDVVDEYANRYHQYSRWAQNGVMSLNGFYFLEEDPATTKVKGMRVLDILSLFIGRR